MAALTADANLQHKGTPTKIAIPAVAGGDTFYAGALVYADATAGLAQVVPASGDVLLGICAKQTVAAAGDLVEVYVDGVWSIPYASAAVGDSDAIIGLNIGTTQSDNPADLTAMAIAALATGDIMFGKMICMNAEETAHAWVHLTAGWIWDDTEKAWI